jgi:asparagine synthase (glutamine-hydrolysing)
MCGICGFLDRTGQTDEALVDRVRRMTETLVHRGPDDEGIWTDAACGLALGHRRLSIIDLSEHGRQPMLSPCGRFSLVFNGEIYNHAQLRPELEALGHRFRGHSDTEVLLAALVQWGVGGAVRRLIGMFAFAFWSRDAKELTLVRDAIGIKPLYYGWIHDRLLFGSELKALRAHPEFRADIDRDVLSLYLRHNYVPAPFSIYRGIFKLPPGTMLRVSSRAGAEHAVPKPWWDMREVVEDGQRRPFHGSVDEAIDALDQQLRDSVRLRMVADVPLGVFLSGGIDSSTVAALMQAQSSQPVRTFSIGFAESDYDEAVHAKAVARHLGTDHTECYVTPSQARDVIPRLPTLYDEPFADSSQIPTALLSEICRRDVTVCLSGDGGDELFCGYDRYFLASRLWRYLGWCPPAIRRLSGPVVRTLAKSIPRSLGGGKLRTLAEFLPAADAQDLYARLNAHWREPGAVVVGGRPVPQSLPSPDQWATRGLLPERMMHADSTTYLPDDLLVKVDRASMGVGLEVRVPLLDHRLVAFVWRLPLAVKVRQGVTKWILRRVLDRYVPRDLIDRPKMGFGVPIDVWLRGPLRPWAEELLDQRRLRREGFLRPDPIRKKWEEHLSGRAEWHYLLWDVLMFQAWLESTRHTSTN